MLNAGEGPWLQLIEESERPDVMNVSFSFFLVVRLERSFGMLNNGIKIVHASK